MLKIEDENLYRFIVGSNGGFMSCKEATDLCIEEEEPQRKIKELREQRNREDSSSLGRFVSGEIDTCGYYQELCKTSLQFKRQEWLIHRAVGDCINRKTKPGTTGCDSLYMKKQPKLRGSGRPSSGVSVISDSHCIKACLACNEGNGEAPSSESSGINCEGITSIYLKCEEIGTHFFNIIERGLLYRDGPLGLLFEDCMDNSSGVCSHCDCEKDLIQNIISLLIDLQNLLQSLGCSSSYFFQTYNFLDELGFFDTDTQSKYDKCMEKCLELSSNGEGEDDDSDPKEIDSAKN